MPKKSRKSKTRNDDEDFDDTGSITSCTTATTQASRRSGASSMMAKLAAEFEDFDIEDVDSQIVFAVDLLGNSNKTKNKQGLDVLLYCLRGNYSVDSVRNNWQTISQACFRVLRGQKDDFCEKACYILGILCFYLDDDDGASFYKELVDSLEGYCREEQSHHKTIGKFDKWSHIGCITLGVACFMFDQDTVSERINFLWTTAISASNRHSNVKAAAAINSVTLSSLELSSHQAKKLLKQPKFLDQCIKFLNDEFAGVITECGILLAVLLTKARKLSNCPEHEIVSFEEVMEDPQVDLSKTDFDDLPKTGKIQKILQISASQNEKSRSKSDNVEVKKILRRINTCFEEDEYDNIPDINFGSAKRCEMLKLNNWKHECFYNCIKFFFKGGAQHHLRFNELIRDYYNLGEPRVADSISDEEDSYENGDRPLTKQQRKEQKLQEYHDRKTDIKSNRKNQRSRKHDQNTYYDE